MFNNIVKLEKLYSFLVLYKDSLSENFTRKDELLWLSKELAKIEDKEYEIAPEIVRKVIDVVRLYEFDRILHSKHNMNEDFEEFWFEWLAVKISQIRNPINKKQKELIDKAISFIGKNCI